MAWDVFGTGKTAVRGGLGLFYARERLSPGLALGGNPPFSGTRLGGPHARLQHAGHRRCRSRPFGAPAAGIIQEAGNGNNWQWNLAVQHELVRNTVLEVAYVGNKGQDLLGQTNLNEIARGQPPRLRADGQRGAAAAERHRRHRRRQHRA